MNNALYRNNPPYVNFNLFERRHALSKREIEKLLGQLRRYRNEYQLWSSNSVKNTIKNLENNLLHESKFGKKVVTQQNILLGRSRLKRVGKQGYRKAPFTASNLIQSRRRLRHISPKKQTLANYALNKLMKQGRVANIPFDVFPTGALRRAISSKPRMGITRANVRTKKTNLNTVKNFKHYINLVRNSNNFYRMANNNNGNGNRNFTSMFNESFGSYRNKYGLNSDQEKKLRSAIRKITYRAEPIGQTGPFMTKLREKYKKRRFLNARNIAKLIIVIKK